jgi:cell wall-associated NlpC family hydrolase
MSSFKQLSITMLLAAMLLGCASSKPVAPSGGEIIVGGSSDLVPEKNTPVAANDYAVYLNTTPDQITNIKLYQFIDEWLSTPYRWGGVDKRGIDCSSLIQQLLKQVYSIAIPRTSVQQFFTDWIDKFGSSRYLSEGDLVFFRTMDDKVVSHVGLYLGNRMFVNASSSKGVSIANLDDPYWKTRFVGAGRIKVSMIGRLADQ